MKRKMLLFVAIALLLPGAAFADNIEELSFAGGTILGTASGFTVSGATLKSDSSDLLGVIQGTNLGTLSFTTSKLAAPGSVIWGAPIDPGGTITITGNGSNPALTGVLFSGSFVNGASWSGGIDPANPNADVIYTLTGYVQGFTGDNSWTDGTLTFNLDLGPNHLYPGYAWGGTSGTALLAVPEPGSLSLMGTGLLGLLGAIRRKMKA